MRSGWFVRVSTRFLTKLPCNPTLQTGARTNSSSSSFKTGICFFISHNAPEISSRVFLYVLMSLQYYRRNVCDSVNDTNKTDWFLICKATGGVFIQSATQFIEIINIMFLFLTAATNDYLTNN